MVEIVFLGINDIGQRVYDWLNTRPEADVLALLTEPDQLSTVHLLDPQLVISAGFRHIVPDDVLSVPEYGAVNFHKAYLPYNRGANPNVWSILEDAPAGVSLHYMTPETDGGPIIDRRRVTVRPDDDALDLYDRLEAAQFEQFCDRWPDIRDGSAETVQQDDGEGTVHYKQDFVDLWRIDRDETVEAGHFLDRLRALTFPPFKNAYFEEDGERYYVELSIVHGDDVQERPGRKIPRYSEEHQP